ncbi:tetratricopeptide repeat protein [Prevotella sp. E9-3]|uniref:type IX secretion system periplasmic lipoprotein PorW/SprE n=1 Tax=Prevotella sp. E9-3 TaxID=2913621 RepID=UPI001EDBD344|nr:tetratricopeptide repeat protein [Prevotella sp. E9-3]UKK48979.1 tetratricopeptide repeat protein [Prevotella sp. E9-3]
MRRASYTLYIIYLALVLLTTAGCSTQKNTAKSRWWHSFNARYNTYYNGSLAYIDGAEEKEKGNKDNFTEQLPLYTVGNKNSRELGKGNFERAIEKSEKAIKQHSIKTRPEWNKTRRKTAKDKEWLSRREYNPFLWKAWLLMGKSQFQKGAFDESAATFSYMSRLYQTQPAINGIARSWLARSYMELDWLYDAEDVVRNMARDSIHYKAQNDWDYTFANYYIKSGDYERALPYLRKAIKHEKRKVQKARMWFLTAQLEASLGHRQESYKAFQRVIRQNPPYELEFNARIAQTEVMAKGNSRKIISKLRRMARSDNNKDYLDQIYYAIGNIYLAQCDTMHAIGAYETGNEKSTRSGIEKGVLLLRLGDLYWDKERYNDAQRCYGEAIGLLDKDRPDYNELSRRSKVLDELVPHTDAIHLQDSLQALAKMSEKDRNEAIDRVIEALKKKEKEERDKAREAEVEKALEKAGSIGNRQQTTQQTPNPTQQGNGQWYFYNQMAVNQGKQQFQKQWGKRENQDNWQRSNLTVLANTNIDMNNAGQEIADSLFSALDAIDDSIASEREALENDSAQNDPHKREYYLAQIPFTEEQVEASNAIIQEALFNSGIIFKDKLDNSTLDNARQSRPLRLSEKQLVRLTYSFPDYEKNDEAWYHLYLLYSRLGEHDRASECLTHLKADYPESEWTILLSDPFYAENARFGVHIEDSLYASTYEAFKQARYGEVKTNAALSAERFPLGENRPKFLFINGLTLLNENDAKGCLEELRQVVEKYPQSEVSPLAGMIIKGVQEGRTLYGGKFDLDNIWARRDLTMSDDSTSTDTLSSDRNLPFLFVMAYLPDSVNSNQLLFEMARYNFSNFTVRNFELNIEQQPGITRLLTSGFLNYDEALQYARKLYANESMRTLIHKCRCIIISDHNLSLIGTRYSYQDYDEFYQRTFAPLTISNEELLEIPEVIEQPDEENEQDNSQEETPTPADNKNTNDFDEDFW